MPLDAERAKVVERLLANNGSAEDPEIADDLKLVEREVADELGSAHPIARDPDALRRFVVARKLCQPKVIEMIEEHMKWRAATLPVPVTDALVAELKKGKLESFGHDTQGRPVIMIRSGKFDPKERDLETAVASVVYMIEKTIAASPKTQITIFYDRTNFSLRKNWDYEFIKSVGESSRTRRAAQRPRPHVSRPNAPPPRSHVRLSRSSRSPSLFEQLSGASGGRISLPGLRDSLGAVEPRQAVLRSENARQGAHHHERQDPPIAHPRRVRAGLLRRHLHPRVRPEHL